MTYRNLFGAVFGASFLVSATSAVAADLAAGEKVFRKCTQTKGMLSNRRDPWELEGISFGK